MTSPGPRPDFAGSGVTSPGPRPDLADVAARLGALLHAAGVAVTPQRAGRLAAAVVLAAPATTAELYWLARVTLVAGQEQVETFDRVFAQVFGGLVDPAEHRGDRPEPPARTTTAGGDARPEAGRDRHPGDGSDDAPRLSSPGDDRPGEADAREATVAAASEVERLRSRDFASLDAEELAALAELTGRLVFAAPPRRSRRHVPARGGSALDVRATLRRSRRSGGDPFVTLWRRRRTRPRRLVLLCDISGSMESYARAYLQLLAGGVGGARAEAFVFATRLTRLTRVLRTASPAVALHRAGQAAPDWSGGTRIGAAIKAFNDDHGRRGVARGAVVVVISDGWDRGDPAVLAREMARLRRLAYRVVWVNPRKASPAYEPLAGGMAAALPHVDAFVSGHSLRSFDEVLAAIGAPGRR